MDPAVHGEFTGAPAKISEESGSPFEAFGGLLQGTTLQVIRPRVIIQSWRSVNFAKDDEDSTLIISFYDEEPDAGRIAWHENRGVLSVALILGVGLAHDKHDLAARIDSTGGPPFAPVEHVLVAIALDFQLHISGI